MIDRKCKCGHLKSKHNKAMLIPVFCNECHCEKYLRFDAPTKFDLITVFFGIGVIAFGVYVIVNTYSILADVPEEMLHKPLISFSLYSETVFPLIVSLVLIGMIISYFVCINDYFQRKNRRNFNNQ